MLFCKTRTLCPLVFTPTDDDGCPIIVVVVENIIKNSCSIFVELKFNSDLLRLPLY
jgi:hypothetical protein